MGYWEHPERDVYIGELECLERDVYITKGMLGMSRERCLYKNGIGKCNV